MENNKLIKPALIAISILFGLSTLGFFIYKGLRTFSDKDRVVTVKGLAEMEMTATAASISINYTISGDNLPEIVKRSEEKKKSIIGHLISAGYSKTDIEISNFHIYDRQTYHETQWRNGKEIQIKVDRYSITQNISINSKDIKGTESKASQLEFALISKDLTSNFSTSYVFPHLNTIKPQLIAESTKNARIAGAQFANDSQAKLGKIKTASQGQITIVGKYYDEDGGGESSEKPKEPYIQKARVVSSIVFFLE